MNTRKERETIVQTVLDLLRELGNEGEIVLTYKETDRQLVIATRQINHETREVKSHEIYISLLNLSFGPDNVLKHRLQEVQRAYQNAV